MSADTKVTHVLSHRVGIAVVADLLLAAGAICPKCAYGTRVTSKNWAKCTKCGERVRRGPMESRANEIKERLALSATGEG